MVAPDCSEKMENYIENNNLTIYRREFLQIPIWKGVDIVIAAVDSQELQSRIFR